MSEHYKEPRIILFDLEIIPNLAKALKYWPRLSSKWETKTLKASVTSICCIGWKVLNEKRVHCINAWDFPEWEEDVNNELPVLNAFAEVIHGADGVVTHNGRRFDKKYLQTKLLMNDMTLMDDVHHSDTKQISSSNFYFIDNKLDTISQELGGNGKLDHEGWELWEKVHGGAPRKRNKSAEQLMTKYCKQDVTELEFIFKKLRPKSKQIPNYNNWIRGDKPHCPRCGSSRLTSEGYRHLTLISYRRSICKDCGSRFRTDVRDRNPRAI